MPFGKYEGKNMRNIDTEYLEWVVENIGKEEVNHAAKEELARRKDENPTM